MEIPIQLQKPEFRFILAGKWDYYKNSKTSAIRQFSPKTREELKELIEEGWKPQAKAPQEFAWQSKNNYSYNHKKIKDWNYNIGILTGCGDLVILDDDSSEKILIKRFEEKFGESFMIREHIYFKLIGSQEKIIFEKGGVHLGELQNLGQQCITAPSIHPLGEEYSIKKDLPLLEININDFKEVFKDYLPEQKKVITRAKLKTNFSGAESLSDLKISDIVSTAGFKSVRGGLLGAHPYHGATNGGNFLVSSDDSTWTCFRHNMGKNSHCGCGDVWALIAVIEGIIDCSQAGANCLSEEDAKKVRQIAIEKYGLKAPKKQEIDIEKEEPKGWANLISIEKMAKKHNFENCPFCNTSFEFIDKLGWWKCSKCKIQGGLTKYANLILTNKRMEDLK